MQSVPKSLIPFIGPEQRSVLNSMLRGEEGEYFANMLHDLSDRVQRMPKTGEADTEDAIVYLHYFLGSIDAWITERDMGDGTADKSQHQAFGMVDLGYGPELGYISLPELFGSGVEIDLHWTPKPLNEIKAAP